MPDENQTQPPERELIKSPFYREILPSIFWGGVRPGYIEMLVVTARARPFELAQKPNKLEYVEEVDLKISPMQAKLLAAWLLSNLKEYERLFGRIKSEEEIGETPKPNWINFAKVDEILAGL